ncbi:hypothetical protein SRHO_G00093390 [Serrasalmus rhombeus]
MDRAPLSSLARLRRSKGGEKARQAEWQCDGTRKGPKDSDFPAFFHHNFSQRAPAVCDKKRRSNGGLGDRASILQQTCH